MADSEDIVLTCLNNFTSVSRDFLEALAEVYPEDTGLRRVILEFDVAITHALSQDLKTTAKTNLIQSYHNHMHSHYAQCGKKDGSFILTTTIPLTQDLSLAEKWTTANTDTKDCILDYLILMNRYSQMYAIYSGIPTNIMSRVTQVATGLAQNIRRDGGNALRDMNIRSLGEQVMQGLSPEELREFATSMLGEERGAAQLLGALAGSGGGGAGMEAVLSMMGGAGAGDMKGMLDQMMGGGGGGV